MPAIFTRYGSWMVTGLTLVISMVTAAMSIAIGQEPTRITEENDLLEFAVTSGELIIRRLLREFQLLFVTVVNGNRASLMIVLRLEPLSEVGSPPNSPVPEERDPSSSHPPLVVNNDENIFFPGHPFQLRCPLCPHLLEIGEICYHPNQGVNILRRSPEDAQTREEVFHTPFEFLCIIPGEVLHPHYPSTPGSPSTSTIVEEAIRTAIAQETPPSPTPSSNSSHAHPIRRDTPEPSSIPARQFRQRRGHGRGDNRPTRVTSRPNRGGRTPTTPRGRVPFREVSNTSTPHRPSAIPSEDGHENIQIPRRGTQTRGRQLPSSRANNP